MSKGEDQEIKECLATLDGSVEIRSSSSSNTNYKPIVVPGLVYRTIITGGFLQLMMTNDQCACNRFNTMIKYYENQRKEAIEYLRNEAGKVSTCRLVVPQEEFVKWMRDGTIDFDTYVILRNYVLRKGYNKRMALRKELDVAKKLLAPVKTAASQLIDKVGAENFPKEYLPEVKPEPKIILPPIQPLTKSDILLKYISEDPDKLMKPMKQAFCGLMFGLLAAKAFCTLLFRILPPNSDSLPIK